MFWQNFIIASIIIAVMSACSPKVAERGKFDLERATEKILPQVTTRAEVVRMLGTPSVTGQFGDRAWYYVAQRKEGVAFFAPEVVDSHVVRITFEGDMVAAIQKYNHADTRQISFTDRETPTAGHEYGLIEQLIGNIGKFNQSQDALQQP